jgi:hypothetical protein
MVDDLIEQRWSLIKDDTTALHRLAVHYVSVNKKNPCCLETIRAFHRTLRRNYKRDLVTQ